MTTGTSRILLSPNDELKSIVSEAIASGQLPAAKTVYPSGSFLFRSGDEVDTTALIESGLVRLYASNEEGSSKTVFMHKPGTLIGFQAFRQNAKSIFNAEALTNCVVYRMKTANYLAFLEKNSRACFLMMTYLYEMMVAISEESTRASLQSVLFRFGTLLILLVEEMGLQSPATLPYTNSEYAAMIGVHANSVSAAIQKLIRAGVIERHRTCIVVLDIENLKKYVESLE